MAILLPCPFCGGEAKSFEMGAGASNDIWHDIECECGARMSGPIVEYHPSKHTTAYDEAADKAAAAWNCRAPIRSSEAA